MDARPMLDPLSINDHVHSAETPLVVEVFIEDGAIRDDTLHK